MRALRWLLPFALALSACAATKPTPRRFGDAASGNQAAPVWVSNIPAIAGAGNNATVTVFDTTRAGTVLRQWPYLQRLMVTGQCDQAVTVAYQVQLTPSTSWIAAAGSNATVTYPANSTTETDFLAQGPESRIRVTNGATQPTTCQFAIALFNTRELGQ